MFNFSTKISLICASVMHAFPTILLTKLYIPLVRNMTKRIIIEYWIIIKNIGYPDPNYDNSIGFDKILSFLITGDLKQHKHVSLFFAFSFYISMSSPLFMKNSELFWSIFIFSFYNTPKMFAFKWIIALLKSQGIWSLYFYTLIVLKFSNS